MKKEQTLLLELIDNISNHLFFKDPRFLNEVDWEVLLQESKEQKVFPLVFNLLKPFVPISWKQEYSKHLKRTDDYLNELASILKLANEKNITLVLQKGFAISKLIYNDLYIREIGDIDFLIIESDVERADSLLRNLGYLPACGKNNYWQIVDEDDYRYLPVPILRDDNHHEFYGYVKKNATGDCIKKFEVELGRHLHKTVRTPHIKNFINHSQKITIHNFECITFDLVHTFLCICENLYDEAEEWYSDRPSLKNCVDVLLFIEKYPELDWEKVKQLSLQYNMYIEVQTVLRYLSSIFTSPSLHQVYGVFSDKILSDERYRFDWVTDFKTRLFLEPETREKELFTVTRNHCFSDRNINFVNPYRVNSNYFGPELFVENSKGYTLSYTATHDTSQLIFKIRVGIDMYSLLDQHEVALFIIDNNVDNYGKTNTLIKYYISFRKVSGLLNIQENGGMSCDVLHEKNEVIVKLPFDLLPIEVDEKGSRKVGYGLSIKYEIYNSVYHWITLNPYEKEFWNNPPIIEIV